MIAHLRNLVSQLSYALPTLRLIWTATRGWTLIWVCLLALQGLLPAASVYLIRLLVDRLLLAIEMGGAWESVQPLLWRAALMGGVLFAIEGAHSVSAWVRAAQAELLRDHLSALVHAQAVRVDLAFYESPAYHDRLERVRTDLHSCPLALLEGCGGLLQHALTLAAMGSLLLPYGAWLPAVLLLGALPTLFVILRFNRRYHSWWEATTPDRRWTQYHDTMLTHSAAAAEVRLFDLGSHFQSAYQTLRQRLRTEQLQFTKAQSLARLSAALMGILMFGAAMAWMVWQALHGLVTLGDVALFSQVLVRGRSVLSALLENMGRIYSNVLFLENLFEFFKLQAQVVDPPCPLPAPAVIRDAIRFEQVSFCYPGSERAALQNFCLTIPAGQMVAIVGANGAGKSTLIKLLCRFYDPDRGEITLDGLDICGFSLVELRRCMTVLFQLPLFYHATAAQNIALGDVGGAPDTAAIEAAALSAGAHEVIARLPNGYDTLLGKWFAEGVELSGGEWQRIALARAFFRQASLVILDEPTSAMDAWAEAAWLTRFRTLARQRTALIITHRFTTAMQADMIHVMHQGRIVESGSHDSLMTQGGLYAASWTEQMRGRLDVDDSTGAADLSLHQNGKR